MDWMMLLSYVATLAVGLYAGYKFSGWITESAMKELMREAGISNDEIENYVNSILKGNLEPSEQSNFSAKLQIRLEQVGNTIYCYEKATDQFLGQADTKEELEAVLTDRLGPITLLVDPEDGADLLQKGIA